MKQMESAGRLLDENYPRQAIEILDRIIAADSDNADALFLRGKAFWRLGMRDRATADYSAAAHLKPAGPAARALENARDIADFFNPDIFNP
ncbi:MAG: hypothetical protein J6C91_02605 [Muribaculaceae bacterium]|nr:hypothetical protein [Muribaculaceae bacterium]